MNLMQRLQSMAKGPNAKRKANMVKGQWVNIRLQPNLISEEFLNIGVGFIDRLGTLHTKVTSDISKLKCLYEDNIDLKSIKNLIDMIDLNNDVYNEICLGRISPQISFSKESFAAGDSVQDILELFFNETVFLTPRERVKNKKNKFVSNSDVRRDVISAVYEHDMNLAREIFPDEPIHTISCNKEHKNIDLPIFKENELAGNIISAYGTPATADIRLWQSVAQMNTVSRHIDVKKRGVFILRPISGNGISRQEVRRINSSIDDCLFHLNDDGVFVEAEETSQSLSNSIVEWSKEAA